MLEANPIESMLISYINQEAGYQGGLGRGGSACLPARNPPIGTATQRIQCGTARHPPRHTASDCCDEGLHKSSSALSYCMLLMSVVVVYYYEDGRLDRRIQGQLHDSSDYRIRAEKKSPRNPDLPPMISSISVRFSRAAFTIN